MSKRYFGTDGVRGVANDALTPEFAFKLGQAAGRFIAEENLRKRAVIGRDTRRSGPMLGAAFASGLASVGIEVVALGVAPTPTVSFVARTFDYSLGAVISASHNPAPDNGIKLLGHDGKKLSDEQEVRIEGFLDAPLDARPTGASLGDIVSDRTEIEGYVSYLQRLVPSGLSGMKVAVDGAHGAAFELGPEVLIRLGAEVVVTGAEPNGLNINAEGGATKPATVGELTVSQGCDIGVAFDGDADRAVFCDRSGRLINGDRTMAAWAAGRIGNGTLQPPIVVGTVMSNMGFQRFLEAHGINLERAQVGDKYVASRISETGAIVGGEQSGHIIFPQHGPTGDGLVTMLEFLRVLKEGGLDSSQVVDFYEAWPQLLVNVQLQSKDGLKGNKRLNEVLKMQEQILGDSGRINLRPSGTQPMVRLMVEADEYSKRDAAADALLAVLIEEFGGSVYSKVDLTNALGD